jgi:hypothetical protein
MVYIEKQKYQKYFKNTKIPSKYKNTLKIQKYFKNTKILQKYKNTCI